MKILRHLLAIAVLPFTVTALVPVWILNRDGIVLRLGSTGLELAVQAGGVGLLAVGLLLFVWSLRRFESDGDGTLAPWDPPRQLVVGGPYRFVRNPMISGVIFVLAAEALVLLSWSHGLWAAMFTGLNAVQIPLVEEPMLRQRFGDAYGEYCRHVPRLLPRLRPWTPDRASPLS